jgi:hypothetical protein
VPIAELQRPIDRVIWPRLRPIGGKGGQSWADFTRSIATIWARCDVDKVPELHRFDGARSRVAAPTYALPDRSRTVVSAPARQRSQRTHSTVRSRPNGNSSPSRWSSPPFGPGSSTAGIAPIVCQSIRSGGPSAADAIVIFAVRLKNGTWIYQIHWMTHTATPATSSTSRSTSRPLAMGRTRPTGDGQPQPGLRQQLDHRGRVSQMRSAAGILTLLHGSPSGATEEIQETVKACSISSTSCAGPHRGSAQRWSSQAASADH